MFSGFTASHPAGGTGLARWQSPATSATPSAQALAQGTTPQAAQPGAGTVVDTTTAKAGPPPVRTETPAARAARMLSARQQPPAAGPPPGPTLRPPPAAGGDPYHPAGYTPGVAAPPPTSLAAPPPAAAPAPAPVAPANPLAWMYGQADRAAAAGYPTSQSQAQATTAGNYMPIPAGFVANGDPVARSPLNIDGTALSGAQLAALAGTGQPGDPFGGGFTPNGGWNAGNGGRSAEEQAAAVAAYKSQYGDPNVTAQQVGASTSNDPAKVEAARQAYQQWQDSVGRFL